MPPHKRRAMRSMPLKTRSVWVVLRKPSCRLVPLWPKAWRSVYSPLVRCCKDRLRRLPLGLPTTAITRVPSPMRRRSTPLAMSQVASITRRPAHWRVCDGKRQRVLVLHRAVREDERERKSLMGAWHGGRNRDPSRLPRQYYPVSTVWPLVSPSHY